MADLEIAVAALENLISLNSNVLPLIGLTGRTMRNEKVIATLCALEHINQKKRRRFKKIQGFVENQVPRFTHDLFKDHFRVSRSTFERIMQLIAPNIQKKSTGRPSLQSTDLEAIVLMSLWTLGNQACYRDIAIQFNMGIGQVHREFFKFCDVLCDHKNELIRWPRGEEALDVMAKFTNLGTFPNVIGCVDITHIPLSTPSKDKVFYYNNKNTYSVTLQSICDAEYRFIDVYTCWQESIDDAQVWLNSSIYLAIKKDPEMIPDGAHILGDNSYPLSSVLITPYRDSGRLTDKQQLYNSSFMSSYIVIEKAFGYLYARFRRLNFLHMYQMEKVKFVIIAACCLHNLCIAEDDEMEFDTVHILSQEDQFGTVKNSDEGEEKRNEIADELLAVETA